MSWAWTHSWDDQFDNRNHWRQSALFTTHIVIRAVQVDELDVVELGPRVAVAYVRDDIKDWPISELWKYRASRLYGREQETTP